mmetsp:Transcript_1974/g.3340  ORF Transcript_1974/g.3340 Transcript_1974/m.3340 type:complete len:306 (+) Transcript_1974:2640-3557(+)
MMPKQTLVLDFPLPVLHRPRQNLFLGDSALVVRLVPRRRQLRILLVRVMMRRTTSQRVMLDLALGLPHHHRRHHRRRMLHLVLPKILLHLELMRTMVTMPTLVLLNLTQRLATLSRNEDAVVKKKMRIRVVERRLQVLALVSHLVRMLPKTRQLQQHPLRLGQPAKTMMRRPHWLQHIHSEVKHLKRNLTMRQLRLHLDPLLPLWRRQIPQHRLPRQVSLSANHLRVQALLQQVQKRKRARSHPVKALQLQLLLKRRISPHQLPLLLLLLEQLQHQLQLSNLDHKLLRLRLLLQRHRYLVDLGLE